MSQWVSTAAFWLSNEDFCFFFLYDESGKIGNLYLLESFVLKKPKKDFLVLCITEISIKGYAIFQQL